MNKYVKLFIILIYVICFISGHVTAEDLNNQYSNEENLKNNTISQFYDGSFTLLRHFSMLEALLSSREKGDNENSGFLIGASSLIPGAGQIINENYLSGGLILFSLGIIGASKEYLNISKENNIEKKYTGNFGYMINMYIQNGITIYSALHAANSQYSISHDKTKAFWVGTASIVPGVGQAINHNWWEAGSLFLAWTFTIIVDNSYDELYQKGEEGKLIVQRPLDFALINNVPCIIYSRSW